MPAEPLGVALPRFEPAGWGRWRCMLPMVVVTSSSSGHWLVILPVAGWLLAVSLGGCSRDAPPPTTARLPTPPAMPSSPAAFEQLVLEDGWGCVVDERRDLWCWGRHPFRTTEAEISAWDAHLVAMPGKVRAVAAAREFRYPPPPYPPPPPTIVACVAFDDAEARCWRWAPEGATMWGPFADTVGALDVGTHAWSEDERLACVLMPEERARCFNPARPTKPIESFRGVLDIDWAEDLVALTRDGKIVRLVEVARPNPSPKFRRDRVAAKIPGARRLASSRNRPVCTLDEHGAIRCAEGGGSWWDRTVARMVEGIDDPVAVLRWSDDHGCALARDDGSVVCIGRNQWGQRGGGGPLSPGAKEPTPIPGQRGIRDIGVARGQTCVMGPHAVRCWGRNAAVRSSDQRSTLALDAKRVMSRNHRTCAVDRRDRTWCWGAGVPGLEPTLVHHPIGPPVAITIGPRSEQCFIDDSRTMVCGSLVSDPARPDSLVLAPNDEPATVLAFSQEGDVLEEQFGRPNLTQGVLGSFALPGTGELSRNGPYELCMVLPSGEIHCLALDVEMEARYPDQYVVPELADAIDVAGTCALRRQGDVVCWDGADTPAEGIGLTHASTLVATRETVCAIVQGGAVACVDRHPSPGKADAVPRNPIDGTAVDLTAGVAHFCAVRPKGDVVCWGDGEQGELGVLAANVTLEGREVTFPAPESPGA